MQHLARGIAPGDDFCIMTTRKKNNRDSQWEADTGGPLNTVNSKYGTSNPRRTVPVMRLINRHHPKSFAELRDLIASHSVNECECGIVSKGTVEDFGKLLYDAQIKEYGLPERYTRQACNKWMDDLFVINSLKGNAMEQEAFRVLSEEFPGDSGVAFQRAIGPVDEKNRIDILCVKQSDLDHIVCGIQVKPQTFRAHTSEMGYHYRCFEKWGHPATFMFYDDGGCFSREQVAETCRFIMKHL